MRGRKPLPSAVKALAGHPGHHPVNHDEPHPPPLDAKDATPPEELTGNVIALKEWARLFPMLVTCRQITAADRGALLALCLEWSRYIEATKVIATTGMVVKAPSGYPIQNPYLAIATKALSGCNKLWPELGLTPSSRSRVKVEGPGPGGDAFSEFDTVPSLDDNTAH